MLSSCRDKLLSAFGFGGEINGDVSHNFPLNGDSSNSYCSGISGVMEAYQKSIRTVELSAPTIFAPIINHITSMAAESKRNAETQVINLFV